MHGVISAALSDSLQIYELYNGGSMPVMFEVQMDNIVRIQEENFQHPVFVCLTPRGEIPPGTTGHVEWIFSPLEARMYSVGPSPHNCQKQGFFSVVVCLKFFRSLIDG